MNAPAARQPLNALPLRRAVAMLRHTLHRIWSVVWRVIALVLLVITLGDGRIRDASLRGRTLALVRDNRFDYVAWEADALWDKARQYVLGSQSYLPEDTRHDLVLDYLQRVAQAQALEQAIERIYADPAIADPAQAAAQLQAERDTLRAQLAADQPLIEGIIEEQVAAVLVDEGFGLWGQMLPPVSMHFSEIPMLLVISPRDRIDYAFSIELEPMTVEQREALEHTIEQQLDVAALIVPLGGISLYPSMIIETSGLARAYEVTAHEWAHHYLMFYPLGLEYGSRPETRIINETTATWFGRAAAAAAMARYYPDQPAPNYPSFLAEAAASPAGGAADERPTDPDAPPPFDYAREMHETRATVEFLLWQGRVEAAETYMEYRRREFVRHGYVIRKLNQAYFAFYGGYQGAPGTGGTDPIGPTIEQIRERSPNLAAFLRTMRGITTRQELLASS